VNAASLFRTSFTSFVIGVWVGVAAHDVQWGIAGFFAMLAPMLVLVVIGDTLMDIRDELRRR